VRYRCGVASRYIPQKRIISNTQEQIERHGVYRAVVRYTTRLKKSTKISLEDLLGKFAVKWILKIPPHLANVATLPCKTLMSAKQALNDKLQGSAAAHFKVWWGC